MVTANENIIDEVSNLYQVIKLSPLRKTDNVNFDTFPMEFLPKIDHIDRVLHGGNAVSPGPIQGVDRPWYMHPHQDDNLIVLFGTRSVDIYTPENGKVENFRVTPNSVYKNGELIYDGPAMLVWPRYVFHRVESFEDGSASLNFAVHYDGLDMETNFNIYDVDTKTGEVKLLRKGIEDQKL